MRISILALTAAIFTSVPLICAAQPAANAAPASGAPPQPPPSALLQPSLDNVHRTLDALHLERWKKGSIRDEAESNIGKIETDIVANLPSLLRDADAAPGAVTRLLPVSRNIDALYDVLLRVEEASRVIAPDDQASALEQALNTLGFARLTLIDRIQGSADTLEKQVVDLRTAVQVANARRVPPPTPIALPCIPPPPHHVVRKATKPAAKPAQKPPAGTPPANQNKTQTTQTPASHS